MTASLYTIVLFWVGIVLGFSCAYAITSAAMQHVRKQRARKADEQRVIRALQQAYAERRATEVHHDACAITLGYNACTCESPALRRTRYTVVPGSENPIGDGLVVDYFRKELDGGWTA